ncbi:hypothetical protein KUW17_16515 [Leisingera aquaemixtae]|uniref:hypothetical protein n=1 Tax=Leisingera TaxID=191028 RepID=UPI001C947DDE|nr:MULTISPECIES: hypothetical protein [Leisingera]MBY6068353.1 hypothetical protein [Leisingera aquaemixtae]MCB4455926.1 hypothetical protein [Leisingera sp. McT4-56]
MAAVSAIWLVFGMVWLAAFYVLARAKRRGTAAAGALVWLTALVWLAARLLFEAETGRRGLLSLYLGGHLVYGLCSLAGWNMGRKRKWRRRVKLFFRRCAGGLPGRNRLQS